ncbi:hypothetical protein TrVE_jg12951 [Triparma verrucosa]|uniref:Helicase-associated domain-containing protein n=1 Tax=Triparma verrucosa TaxID=1606542 RepID=A0A9W7BPT7_9STRA|nr:hypothetical protein TrVE_jg12951 [Triparma verrucosa]
MMVSSVDTSCLRMGVLSSENQLLVESFRLQLRHPSIEPFLKSAERIFENCFESVLQDFKEIQMKGASKDEFMKALENTKIVSCDSEFTYYKCVENKEDAKISKRVTVFLFVLLDKGKLLSFTTSIEEPVKSNLLPPGARILQDLNGRASSLAAGYEAANATSVDGGLAEIIGIFEAIRDAGGTVVFQSGAADVYALWSTSAIGRFINGTFVGRSLFETRLQSLFGQDSKKPLQWYDSYRNPFAIAISKCLYGAIYGARLSLSLTTMSKILHELLDIGDVLGPDAHNAAHDAKFTLLLALWQARATNEGTVKNLCDRIKEMFLKLTVRQPAKAIAMLTKAGRAAVETYDFIDGREGKREREVGKWIYLLQADELGDRDEGVETLRSRAKKIMEVLQAEVLQVKVKKRRDSGGTQEPWVQMFQKYEKKCGVFVFRSVVETAEELKLKQWALTQRWEKKKGKLSADRVEKLEGIDFIWDPREARWLEMLQRFVRFKTEKGHVNVVQTQKFEGENLGGWVADQRNVYKNGKLSADRVGMLEEAGIVWVGRKGGRKRKMWGGEGEKSSEEEPVGPPTNPNSGFWSLEERRKLHEAYNASIHKHAKVETEAWRLGINRSENQVKDWFKNKIKKHAKMGEPLPDGKWGLEIFIADTQPWQRKREKAEVRQLLSPSSNTNVNPR